MRPRIVVTHAAGQLANHLNLFANFVALARETGAVVLNPAFHKYADDFASTRGRVVPRYPPRPSLGSAPKLARRKAFDAAVAVRDKVRFRQHLDPRPLWTRGMETRVVEFGQPYVHMDDWAVANGTLPRRALFVNGYLFRAKTLVEKHRDAIIDFFKPIPKHNDAAAEAAGLARADATKLVGVHVRWGDYQTYRNGQFYYDLATYKRLMEQAIAAFPDERVRFLVCSADTFDAADFGDLPVSFGPGSAAGDLYALSHCDAILGPPSSFSAWASFYGGGDLYHAFDAAEPVTRESFTPSPVPRTDWSEADE